MRNHFITFGDGTRQHRGAARRLVGFRATERLLNFRRFALMAEKSQ